MSKLNELISAVKITDNKKLLLETYQLITDGGKVYLTSKQIISSVCRHLSYETVRLYEKSRLSPQLYNMKYNMSLHETYLISDKNALNNPITAEARNIVDMLKEFTKENYPDLFTNGSYFYRVSHGNSCIITLLYNERFGDMFNILNEFLSDKGWYVTVCRPSSHGDIELVVEPIILLSASTELKDERIFYHVTKKMWYNSIKNSGIKATSPSNAINHTQQFLYNESRVFFATYCYDDEELNKLCKSTLSAILLRKMNEALTTKDSDLVLILIDASKINKTTCYVDRHNDNHYFTTSDIPKEAILYGLEIFTEVDLADYDNGDIELTNLTFFISEEDKKYVNPDDETLEEMGLL